MIKTSLITLFIVLVTMSSIPLIYAQQNEAGSSGPIGATVVIYGTCGITSDTTTLDYGRILSGQVSPNAPSVTLTNTGNIPASISLGGTDWIAPGAEGPVILASNTHYSIGSALSFDDMTPLTTAGAPIGVINPGDTMTVFFSLAAILENPFFTGSPSQTIGFISSC